MDVRVDDGYDIESDIAAQEAYYAEQAATMDAQELFWDSPTLTCVNSVLGGARPGQMSSSASSTSVCAVQVAAPETSESKRGRHGDGMCLSPPRPKRLRSKVPGGSVCLPIVIQPFAAAKPVEGTGEVEVKWGRLSEAAFKSLCHRDAYMTVYNKLHYWYVRLKTALEAAGQVDEVTVLTAGWKAVKTEGLVAAALMGRCLQDTHAPDWIRSWVLERAASKKSVPDSAHWLSSRAVLLTWQGDWGIVPGTVEILTTDIAVKVTELQKSEWAQALWDDFLKFVQAKAGQFAFECWAASLEVCTSTLANSGVLRLHCHAFLKSEFKKTSIRHARALAWRNTLPHKSGQVAGVRIRGSGSWAGMYYLQCSAKTGSVFQSGNKEPFVDYGVNGSWIFGLAQAGKIVYGAARRELIRTTQGLQRKLADLDRWHREATQVQLEAHVSQRLHDLEGTLLAFRVVPEIEEWKQVHTGLCMRKKFLVLEGPSGVGKTEYVKRLFGVDCTYEINMAASDDFCLRNFVPLKHRLLLWDEARPQTVLQQRKLFQCPAAWIDLGASPTGAFVYRVWVNDAVMVINSNKWSLELSKCYPEDIAWIQANQCLVSVQASLVSGLGVAGNQPGTA